MLVAIVALSLVLDGHLTPDPAILVGQLGSTRYALRVSAEGELLRLGRAALPALRAAQASRDAEIRTRAASLLARIENSLVLEATPIRLDLGDVSVAEAVAAIARQSSPGPMLTPEELPTLADRRMNLRSSGPLTFWRAIDAVCVAGGLRAVAGQPAAGGAPEGPLWLVDGPMPGTGLVSDDGAFRVRLTSVHSRSEILLDQPAPADRANREFFLQFALSAEPRLSVTRNGPVRVSAAVDDQGRSLLDPSEATADQRSSGYFGLNVSSTLRFRVDLDTPASPSRKIATLRGTIPVVAAARKSGPLHIPLAGPMGRSSRSEQVALTLLDHRPGASGRPATILVAIRPLGEANRPAGPKVGGPLGDRPDTFQPQLEVLDANGRPLAWFPSSTAYDGEETRMTMTVAGREAPASLRFHDILKANAEVTFEFRDIPIP